MVIKGAELSEFLLNVTDNGYRRSVTFHLSFIWLNGRYISVTIQSPYIANQLPFRRLSVIFTFLFAYKFHAFERKFMIHWFKFVLETWIESQIQTIAILGLNSITSVHSRPGYNKVLATQPVF